MTTSLKKILQIVGLCVFFIIIATYALWGSHNLIFGVKIRNVNIADGLKVTNSVMEIRGNAKNATSLTLDGREISIDENGNFNETIALLAGYNIISIKAKDKFGYGDEKSFRLIGGFAGETI